ncbi:MAG: cytochrome c oxidase subunit [Bacteroidota bacterium]|nr:cytochrome c oxidase subunit [Bacteroidota bacterium]
MNHVEQAGTDKHTGYGGYVLIWLILLGLTVTTVAVAGIDLGEFILFTAMLIAAVKSWFVINVFMHIKFDEPIFKVFIIIALMTLLAVFILTSIDVFYR